MTEEATAPEASEPIATTEAPDVSASAGEAVSRALEQVGMAEEASPVESPEVAEAPSETPETQTGPKRGPDGKFVKSEGSPEATTEGQEAASEAETPKEPENSPVDAPARFSGDAKAEWANTPQAVQSEITRAMGEMEKGLAEYQEWAGPLKEFADKAKAGGRQLHEVVTEYEKVERALTENPIQGLSNLCQSLGFSLEDVANHVLGRTPDQQRSADQAEIATLRKEISSLKANMGQMGQTVQGQQEAAIVKQVEAFRAENPRFDELQEAVAAEISAGHDLPTAYKRAELLNPVAVQPQPDPAPAPETQAPQKSTTSHLSLSGAPASGSNPTTPPPAKSAREALSRAFQTAGV